MPIKIFTNQSLLIAENRKHIFFFFLELAFTHKAWIHNYFYIVDSISDADIALFPLDICYTKSKYGKKIIQDFIDLASLNNIPIWLYSGGDIGWSKFNSQSHIVHFRLAGFKSKYKMKTEILPAFIQDPLQNIGFKPIKSLVPPYSIGFVGHASGGLNKWVKEFLIFSRREIKRWLNQNTDYQAFYPSGVRRFLFLNQLKKMSQLHTNYILRDQYRAGVGKRIALKQETEKEFHNNIQSNLFTFCMRGGGNFSIRFYETLAHGRIPFYLDTDTQLPLENQIDWDRHIFRFKPEDNLQEIQVKFLAFTRYNDLEQMQLKNRLLWENSLSREAYARQLFLKYKPA